MLYRDLHYINRIGLLELERELDLRLQRRDGLVVERTPDEIDALQATIDNETEIANLNRTHQLRSRVRAALDRLEAGSYGQCETCDSDIAAARLKALPWASRCLPCEEERERSMGTRARSILAGAKAADLVGSELFTVVHKPEKGEGEPLVGLGLA
jgi:DnaK suppressor protein